jgi:hypothetical protein
LFAWVSVLAFNFIRFCCAHLFPFAQESNAPVSFDYLAFLKFGHLRQTSSNQFKPVQTSSNPPHFKLRQPAFAGHRGLYPARLRNFIPVPSSATGGQCAMRYLCVNCEGGIALANL